MVESHDAIRWNRSWRQFRASQHPSTLQAGHLESLTPNEVLSEAGSTEDPACHCLLDSCAHSCLWSPSLAACAASMALTRPACTRPAGPRTLPSWCAPSTITLTCIWDPGACTASSVSCCILAVACSLLCSGWRSPLCFSCSTLVSVSCCVYSINSLWFFSCWDTDDWTLGYLTTWSSTACKLQCFWWVVLGGALWFLSICSRVVLTVLRMCDKLCELYFFPIVLC